MKCSLSVIEHIYIYRFLSSLVLDFIQHILLPTNLPRQLELLARRPRPSGNGGRPARRAAGAPAQPWVDAARVESMGARRKPPTAVANFKLLQAHGALVSLLRRRGRLLLEFEAGELRRQAEGGAETKEASPHGPANDAHLDRQDQTADDGERRQGRGDEDEGSSGHQSKCSTNCPRNWITIGFIQLGTVI